MGAEDKRKCRSEWTRNDRPAARRAELGHRIWARCPHAPSKPQKTWLRSIGRRFWPPTLAKPSELSASGYALDQLEGEMPLSKFRMIDSRKVLAPQWCNFVSGIAPCGALAELGVMHL